MKILNKIQIDEIENILKSGGVVIFPTDTVFGIGCLYGKDEALRKIFKIKKRPQYKKLPLLINNKKMAKQYINNSIPKNLESLISKFSPGGLTYVIKAKNENTRKYSYSDNSIAFRIPNSPYLLKVIKKLNSPLFATSANISGNKEIKNLDLMIDTFSKKVDCIVKGDIKKNIPSTIISFVDKKPYFIRTGDISKKSIRKHVKTKTNIVFVCTGNTCRSPMAEEYAKKIAGEDNFHFSSSGTHAFGNYRISSNSSKIIKDFNGNPNKRSSLLNEHVIVNNDLIIVMASEHKEFIQKVYNTSDVYTLGEFAINHGVISDNGNYQINIKQEGIDIKDPVGENLKYYKERFHEIKKYLKMIRWEK